MNKESSDNHEKDLSTLPQGWIPIPLGDVIVPSKEKSDPTCNSRCVYVGLEHIEKDTGKLLAFGISDEVKSTKTVFHKGDLLYGKLRPYLNKVWLADREGICSTDILVFLKSLGISNEFLRYRLLSRDFVRFSNQQVSGIELPRVNVDKISPFPILLPPLPEQHRIVAKIEELFTQLDAGVASLKKAQAQLKRYRQAVLKAAFEGRLTQEWREEHKGEIEPAEIFLERYSTALKKRSNGKIKLPPPPDSSELEHLPVLWTWTKIGMFIEIVRGASPRPAGSPRYFGGNIPWITVGELTKDENVYLKNVSSFVTDEGKEKSRFIHANTLLLTNSGATLGVPKITLIAGCINDGSVALLGLDDTPKLYLYFYLKSQTKRLRQINQGAAQPNLNTDIVRNIIVPLPPLEEQKEVINEFERHFSQIDHLERIMETSLRQAESLRQSILKRAFEGKLVPQDPDDEPASVLLERIKTEKACHTAETKKGKTLQPKPSKRKIKNGN